MLLFFLKWFKPVKYAQIKSAKVFNVFNQTVVSLQTINATIASEKQKRIDAITRAQTEHDNLHQQSIDNESVINNIQKFFSK
jgi:hypothetical protein